MANTTSVANRLEAKAASKSTGMTVYDLIEKQRGQIQKALPKTGLTAERLARIVSTQIRINPKLASCTAESLLGAIMLCAQLGLEPGPLGQAYLVPYGQECTFQVGYKGLITLAYRSGGIVISAHAVYENDNLDFDYGTDTIRHNFILGQDRGKFIGVWAKAVLPNGQVKIKVLPKSEVEYHRDFSKGKDSMAWRDSYEAMATKTAIRVLSSQVPLGSEVQQAIVSDDHAVVFNGDEGIIAAQDAPAVIDVTEECEVEVEANA